MSQKYTIEFFEQVTTNTGKVKANCLLKDEQGQDHDGVTLWADFPNFANLAAGHTVEGNLTAKDYNGKTYFTLYPIKPNPMGSRPVAGGQWAGVKKAEQIAAAQEKKAEYISQAQDKKELSIAYFNSCNLALQVIGPASAGLLKDSNEYQQQFIIWRDFFLAEWMKWDAKPENEKRIPF